jgi:hypothetical protein
MSENRIYVLHMSADAQHQVAPPIAGSNSQKQSTIYPLYTKGDLISGLE